MHIAMLRSDMKSSPLSPEPLELCLDAQAGSLRKPSRAAEPQIRYDKVDLDSAIRRFESSNPSPPVPVCRDCTGVQKSARISGGLRAKIDCEDWRPG